MIGVLNPIDWKPIVNNPLYVRLEYIYIYIYIHAVRETGTSRPLGLISAQLRSTLKPLQQHGTMAPKELRAQN